MIKMIVSASTNLIPKNQSLSPSRTQLLIEIFSEEIPGRMQKEAEDNAKALFEDLLTEHNLSFDSVSSYVSSRRVAVIVWNLEKQTQSKIEEKRGPKLTSPAAALEGFLKSTGFTKEQLRQEGDYYFADLLKEGVCLKEKLPYILNAFLDKMPWPKAMTWHNSTSKTMTRSWIRPIRHITVMMDDEPIVMNVLGLDIMTSHQTLGHRFLTTEPIFLKGATEYVQQLAEAYVIASFEERKTLIWQNLTTLADLHNLTVKEDSALLDEVTGLIDYPYAQIGAIEEKFMKLPSEVLSTSMRVHQKYFTLYNKKTSTQESIESDTSWQMAPFFGVITNVPNEAQINTHSTPSKVSDLSLDFKKSLMMQGLQKVLTARLSDALFFYETDVNNPLETLALQRYSSIIFHEKTGSLADKIKRLHYAIEQLHHNQNFLAPLLGFVEEGPSSSDIETKNKGSWNDLKRAALLSKADLFTQMVGEFPELQGIMGRIYAAAQGETHAVSDALQEHYQPLGPSKKIPSMPVARALSLIDKMDTLVGFIGHQILPTGNKDPLAIRRTALGIIRLCTEWHFKTNTDHHSKQSQVEEDIQHHPLLLHVLQASLQSYQRYHLDNTAITEPSAQKGLFDNRPCAEIQNDVLAFIKTRFEIYKKTQ